MRAAFGQRNTSRSAFTGSRNSKTCSAARAGTVADSHPSTAAVPSRPMNAVSLPTDACLQKQSYNPAITGAFRAERRRAECVRLQPHTNAHGQSTRRYAAGQAQLEQRQAAIALAEDAG